MRVVNDAVRREAGSEAPVRRLAWVAALLMASACSSGPTTPSTPSTLSTTSSLSAGQWTGTTAQGVVITFTVSSSEILTTLGLGYTFNGCSGTQTFSNLNVPTAPDVMCIPGPCSVTISSYRAFAFSNGSPGAGPVTAANGLFLLGGQAQGQVTFQDYPGCGTASGVAWTATRQ